MKKIQLNSKRILALPENWDELLPDQVRFVFRNLIRLYGGEITPFEFQFDLLRELTGYRPRKQSGLLDVFRMIIWSQKHYFNYITERFEHQENIRFNLIRLSEQLNFIFKVEHNRIIPFYDFAHNPFGKHEPVYFNRDVVVETNITARQFTDCVDLINGMNSTEDERVRRVCLQKVMAVLYGYDMEEVEKIPVEIPFGVMFWFTGIVKFFREHPVYSVLYDSAKKEDDYSKINLGMGEVLMYLEKEGYRDPEDKNLIDFFNLQVKALKDSVNNALSQGAKIEDLVKKTGLSMNTINRLRND
jgi:hypothetical protein